MQITVNDSAGEHHRQAIVQVMMTVVAVVETITLYRHISLQIRSTRCDHVYAALPTTTTDVIFNRCRNAPL